MIRLIFLCLLGFSSGFDLSPDCATSATKGALLAGSDLMDAAVSLYEAYSNCTDSRNTLVKIKCTVDVSQTVHSLNSLVNNILAVLDDCKMLNDESDQCGQETSKLTEALAGLTAAIAGSVGDCPKPPVPLPDANPIPVENVAKCTTYMKDSSTTIFRAVSAMGKIKNKASASNILYTTQVIAALAGNLAGAVGNCNHVAHMLGWSESHKKKISWFALCASASANVVKYAAAIGTSSLGVQKQCLKIDIKDHARLFSMGGQSDIEASYPNLFLVALLPITAVLSFIGGRMVRKPHQTETRGVWLHAEAPAQIELVAE